MALFVEMALVECGHQTKPWTKKAILIVIWPLVALMNDQVNPMQTLGIPVAYVASDQCESVLQRIEKKYFPA